MRKGPALTRNGATLLRQFLFSFFRRSMLFLAISMGKTCANQFPATSRCLLLFQFWQRVLDDRDALGGGGEAAVKHGSNQLVCKMHKRSMDLNSL
ncbi:hypothetical protein JCGZ_10806 [Jatropha curcas]|uniref:Secreted protein n=1 Tax=Jatropha curcas TaxID=180498 RepID=A0A067KK88_JATCU|nr:hypothetical protein JCGZ_10806 [Jatropha curcas]